MELDDFHIESIIRHFSIPDGAIEVEPFGSGHIHQTFLVKVHGAPLQQFIIQKINHSVFEDPAAVMENIRLVLDHLALSSELRPLEIVATIDGQTFFYEPQYGYWRMYKFVEQSYAVDTVEHEDRAFQGASAFAAFLSDLSSLDAGLLHETIKDFHNLSWRFQQLKTAIEVNQVGRLNACQATVEQALQHESRVSELYQLTQNPELSPIVTHNDTKINNILFDQATHKALAVVDLDTVMPGLLMYDFGDMIRTFCSSTAEDGDPKDVFFQSALYEAACRGFFQKFSPKLSGLEQASLIVGPWYMTFIMGIRFLADYLNGDVYYQIDYPQQNLNRARNQLQYCTCLLEAEAWMSQIINDRMNQG